MILRGKELARAKDLKRNSWTCLPQADQGAPRQNLVLTCKKKAARRCRLRVPAKQAKRIVYFPRLAYQSALTGVKLAHFSGKSSNAKMAVTGQTGTQAPQSMHSVGWMYSCVSAANSGSSLRGWMQSTGQTSTQAVSFVPMQGSAIT